MQDILFPRTDSYDNFLLRTTCLEDAKALTLNPKAAVVVGACLPTLVLLLLEQFCHNISGSILLQSPIKRHAACYF